MLKKQVQDIEKDEKTWKELYRDSKLSLKRNEIKYFFCGLFDLRRY